MTGWQAFIDKFQTSNNLKIVTWSAPKTSVSTSLIHSTPNAGAGALGDSEVHNYYVYDKGIINTTSGLLSTLLEY